MKIAFLFAGQGSQYVGMGQDFYTQYPSSKALYDSIQVDFDLKKVCFEGPKEVLNDTSYTQSCLLTTSLAMAEALRSEGIQAQGVAGLSLGEYSALTYAHAMEVNVAVDVVRKRGRLMADALPMGSSGMLAVLSGDQERLEQLCCDPMVLEAGVLDIANYNSPNQTVLSGSLTAINVAKNRLSEQGIRSILLNVSGAFHSCLLREASMLLEVILSKASISEPIIPVYFNLSGKTENHIKSALTQQIYSSVQWIKTIQNLDMDGFDTFIEIGPGNTLTKLVNAILPNARVFTVEKLNDIDRLKGELYV